jgi:hypothetical protein
MEQLAKFGGVIALALVLFYVFRNDEHGNVNDIIHALGGANQSVVGSLEGRYLGIFPNAGAPRR